MVSLLFPTHFLYCPLSDIQLHKPVYCIPEHGGNNGHHEGIQTHMVPPLQAVLQHNMEKMKQLPTRRGGCKMRQRLSEVC